MSKRWIVFVTRINARIFGEEEFHSIIELKNKIGRAKNKSLTRGKPGVGRSRFSGTRNGHAMTGEKNPHEDAAISFAKKIGAWVFINLGYKGFIFSCVIAAYAAWHGRKVKMIPHVLSSSISK